MSHSQEKRLPPHKQGPKAGTKWFRPNSRGIGFVINKPAETRHVFDRTLGGDVLFVSGRFTRHAHKERCTLSEWLDWAHDAKEVKS
jgi:hypothetical protein